MYNLLCIVGLILVGLLGIAHFLLGLFDRPVFARREHLAESKKEVFAIIATSTTEPSISQYCDLLSTAKRAIDSHERSEELRSRAAASYGAPPGSPSIGIFAYFDDDFNKASATQQKWGCGMLIEAYNCKEAQKIFKELSVEENPNHPSFPVRSLRLGTVPVLRGRIP